MSKALTARKLAHFDAAVASPDLNGTDCRVLWAVLQRIGDEGGQCWESPAAIGERIHVCERTVRRSLATLTEGGWLSKTAGKKGKNTRYSMTNLSEKPPDSMTNLSGFYDKSVQNTVTNLADGNLIEKPLRETVPVGRHSTPADTDLKTTVFGPAREWLEANTGKTEQQIRPLIGRWCRDHGEAAVLMAVDSAKRNSAVDPIAWVQKELRHERTGTAPKGRTNDRIERTAAAFLGVDPPE